MNLEKTLNLIPKKVFRLLIWSILSAFLTAGAVYGVAMVLQVFAVILGFSEVDNIAVYMQPLTSNIIFFFIAFTCVVILQGVGQFLQSFINIAFAETFNYEVRKKFLNILFYHDSSWGYDLGTTSNIMAEVIPKSASYVTSVARFITLIIQVVVLGVLSILNMPMEFLISLAILSTLTPVILFLNRKSRMYGASILKRSENLNKNLMRSVKNFLYLKILGIEEKEKLKTIKCAKSYYEQFMKSAVYYSLASSLPITISTLVVVYLFYFFSAQGSSMPELLTLFYILYRFAGTLSQTVAITNGLSMYRPNFNRILSILDDAIKIEDRDLISSNINKEVSISNSLIAENISFSYLINHSNKFVFDEINIDLPEKNMLVVKGASGSGKTTLLMVLIGVLTHSSGIIKWGGIELNEINNRALRKKIGYMGPEPFIISGTIRDNLGYGLNNNPIDEELWIACNEAEADDFIKALDQGLDSPLSEMGEGLSMGQKQRLGMARALLRQPEILILDEVTANLDRKTELALIQNIMKMKDNMTILVSTHSNAFDDIADQILELGDNPTYLKK